MQTHARKHARTRQTIIYSIDMHTMCERLGNTQVIAVATGSTIIAKQTSIIQVQKGQPIFMCDRIARKETFMPVAFLAHSKRKKKRRSKYKAIIACQKLKPSPLLRNASFVHCTNRYMHACLPACLYIYIWHYHRIHLTPTCTGLQCFYPPRRTMAEMLSACCSCTTRSCCANNVRTVVRAS